MSNHHRGLWGYYGETKGDGRPLTIQATGIGGPSAAIVLAELAELGVRRAVRVGTCSSVSAELGLGQVAVVESALAGDGASRSLGAGASTAPSPSLLEALRTAAPAARPITVATTTSTTARPGREAQALDGAAAVELGDRAALRARPRGRGRGRLPARGNRERGRADRRGRLLEAELEMGRAAAAALAAITAGS